MTEDSDAEDAIDTRVCPECGESDTKRVSIDEPMGLNSGSALIETRACNHCYAGYKIEYVPDDIEVHHDPEVDV